MAEYSVVLIDADGYDISVDFVEGVKAAKERAKYFLGDTYVRNCGTTHDSLNTNKVEVRNEVGDCLYDFFRKEG